jgi:hypothetical protein
MKLECTIGRMRLPIALLFCGAVAWAQPKTEIGEINGAQFRIDKPEKWNGALVMYCHACFDMRVVFDFYFPRALPSPAKVLSDYMLSPARNAEIEKLLDSKPAQSTIVRRWAGIRTNKELAGTLVFNTYVLKDVQTRGGGNPFDNRNTIYEGSDDDNALNDGVIRYAADPGAVAYLQHYYTRSGRLTRPLLAIHTTYDPTAPPWVTNMYSKTVESAGSGKFFVQQYVRRDGHCAIQPAELGRGFMQLRQWVAAGARPAPGLSQ